MAVDRWADWVPPAVETGGAPPEMDEASPERKAGRLIPTYGSSCKPLPLLTCRDVHPCKVCRGVPLVIEWTDRLECPDCPGLSCVLCGGFGEVAIQRSAECVCESCGGSGVGAMPKGSLLACGACERSGRDHMAGLQLSQAERRQIDLDRRMAAYRQALLERLQAVKGKK